MATPFSAASALVLLLAACQGVAALSPPPHFTVDLDVAPVARWAGAVKTVLDAHPWEWSFGAAFASHNASLFDNVTDAQFDALGAALTLNFPTHAAELRGISADFAANGHSVSFEYLAAWVYFHELAHSDIASPDARARFFGRSCCAVLARDASSSSPGVLQHVGNMDQSPKAVRNVTLRLEFVSSSNGTRGGDGIADVAFEGVDWYWFTTGVTRAVRRGFVSVQENWRFDAVLPAAGVLADIRGGAVPQVLVFRQLLEAAAAGPTSPARALTAKTAASGYNFSDVVAHLSSVRLAAPFYVIVAGAGPAGDGVVMARDNTGLALPLRRLSDVTTTASAGGSGVGGEGAGGEGAGFFLVQTNYDWDQPDPADDPRRTALEAYLIGIGPVVGTTQMGMFAAVSTFPAHNPDTAYTAAMQPDTGALVAFVRTAMCPEDPADPSVVADSLYCQA